MLADTAATNDTQGAYSRHLFATIALRVAISIPTTLLRQLMF
jgi:hypothetical protein